MMYPLNGKSALAIVNILNTLKSLVLNPEIVREEGKKLKIVYNYRRDLGGGGGVVGSPL